MNTQPAEKVIRSFDGSLDVVDVWKTLQGEGPFAGTPAVFVRLAGCTLRCEKCDTDYTSNRSIHQVGYLLNRVIEMRGASRLVVITGGEPLRQDIETFVRCLLDYGFSVQLETNGLHFNIQLPWRDITTVCSPKTPKINTELLPHITAYKYILSADAVDEKDGLPTSALGMPSPPARPRVGFCGTVYVQPLDEGSPERNKLHEKAALDSCLKYGYALSLQLHKLLGLN